MEGHNFPKAALKTRLLPENLSITPQNLAGQIGRIYIHTSGLQKHQDKVDDSEKVFEGKNTRWLWWIIFGGFINGFTHLMRWWTAIRIGININQMIKAKLYDGELISTPVIVATPTDATITILRQYSLIVTLKKMASTNLAMAVVRWKRNPFRSYYIVDR